MLANLKVSFIFTVFICRVTFELLRGASFDRGAPFFIIPTEVLRFLQLLKCYFNYIT